MELREHEGRLACDACGGIMMSIVDFEHAVIDFGAQATSVQPRGESARARQGGPALQGESGPRGRGPDSIHSARVCPRCDAPMLLASLVVDKRTLTGEVDHCPHHGVWFAPGALETAFIELARRTEGSRGPGNPLRGWLDYPVPRLGSRRELSYRPRNHTPWKTALGDRELRCPSCRVLLAIEGMRWPCTEHGAFVEHAAFAEMVEEMTGQPWEPLWSSEHALPSVQATGVCPACSVMMTSELIRGITTERCAEHGLWFSGDDLVHVLDHFARPERRGWLSRLFR